MAQLDYKIDLRNPSFPMLHEQLSRTIIGSTAGEAPSAQDRPHLEYCHNVMPTSYGMASVGYASTIAAIVSPPYEVTDVRVIFGSAKSRIYLAWDAQGNVYALLPGSVVWLAIAATVPATGGASFSAEDVTVGTVNGVSYIFYSGIGAFTYNESTNVLDAVTLTGLTIADILGVVASAGYLIAYTTQAIAWSSTLDATDFVPSAITGAGGGNVAGIGGAIEFATPNTLGILLYAEANVIAGTYTGNSQYPFKFREVPSSNGGASLDRTAYEANSPSQYAFTKGGLQAVSSQRAEAILPEVTDFMTGRRFEDYNETTKLYEITDLASTATMVKKVKLIASRYLVMSYGITDFTHAIVYDIELKRLGKLKITHKDIFEYIGAQAEVSRGSIAVLLSTGEVKLVDFTAGAASSSGVAIVGKLQYVRGRGITLLAVDVENVSASASFNLYDRAALDGKTEVSVAGTLASSAEGLRVFNFRNTAKNHALSFEGRFDLVTAIVQFKLAGRR